MSCPPKTILPALGGKKPLIKLKKVVFPAPLGPMIARNSPLATVSERLGHKDQMTTLRIYSHALPKDANRAAETWDAVINGDVLGGLRNPETVDPLVPVQ